MRTVLEQFANFEHPLNRSIRTFEGFFVRFERLKDFHRSIEGFSFESNGRGILIVRTNGNRSNEWKSFDFSGRMVANSNCERSQTFANIRRTRTVEVRANKFATSLMMILMQGCLRRDSRGSYRKTSTEAYKGRHVGMLTLQSSGNLGYSWYKNQHQIPGNQQSLVIQSGTRSDIGHYQCETGTNVKSDSIRLDFRPGWLILQVPPVVHEGDSLSLRCHSRSRSIARNPVFYKDNKIIKSPVSGSVLHIGRVDVTTSGTYKCVKEILFYYLSGKRYRFYRDERYITVQEMFTIPQINMIPDQVIEGDHMTITCDTKLSPRRATTELQFVFYRNGHNVQGFSSSNQYGVPSAQLEDSGNYTCEVQTSSGSVRKRSNMEHIHIQELFPVPQIKVSPDQVTEGDHMTITCDTKLSPHRETTELQFAFYRNGHNVQGFSSSKQYGVPSAQLEDSGNYICEVQTPTGSVRKRSNVLHIQKLELFTIPQIQVIADQVTEGDHMTITCDTKLSPHRETTELQFVFYRNGHNVQGFSSSNQYGVPSAQLEDSGNYTCEVQTSSGSVRKRSREAHIQTKGEYKQTTQSY
ncbi:hypothetical protein XELAEV_18042845mg [Xenopus laevis]|uniref:Ig-like domain-containing protein n=1 Tax=Xenopus laevis TaxID=8355 RepID=A0A974C4P7_XENLA|nr:hypothetical protein XELAEV_18042845mg [Xenopus laevis]